MGLNRDDLARLDRRTWRQKVEDLTKELEREPTMDELLDMARTHTMNAEEIQAQRESWTRQDMD